MTGNSTRGWSLSEFRFEGYSNTELADVVDMLGHGPGADGMTHAANNLNDVADSLNTINTTLTRQLGEIGVHWQSREAADAAHHTLGGARNYGRDAGGQVAVSATSIDEHGEAYRVAKRGMPDSSALRDPGYAPGSPGFTGHEVDNTEAERRREAARNQAIDAFNGYSDTGRQSVDRHESLPPVQHAVHHEPPASHDVEPVGTTTPSGTTPPQVSAPANPGQGYGPAPVGGGAPTGPAPSQPPVVGGGPLPSNPIVGGSGPVVGPAPVNPGPGVYPAPIAGGGQQAGSVGGYAGAKVPTGGPLGGVPGGAPGGSVGGAPAGGVPGGAPTGGAPGVVPGPGGRMGAGAIEAGPVGGVYGSAGAPRAVGGLGNMAGGAMNAVAGGASGAGAAAAGAESGDRLVRGRPGGTPMSREGAMSGVEPEGSAASRAASRVGANGQRSRSIMEPAAGTSRQEEDGSHLRRYGVEAEDLFADQRMVANPVLGDDEPEL